MDLSNIDIVLIEDNPDDAWFTIRAFKEHGLDKNVVHLKNGEEALDFIFHSKEFQNRIFNNKTKIILLDLNLPRVNGIEILRMIKNDAVTKSVPVVILTSSDSDPNIRKCKELGADDYIIKPVTAEGFFKVVSGLSNYWS